MSRQHGAWSNRVGARVVVAACLAGALLLPSSAMAAGAEAECVSTWRSIGKLWDQYGDQIKRLVAQIAAGEDGDAEKIKADLDELETKSRGYKEKVGTYLGDSPLQTGPRPLSSKKRSAVTTHQRTWVSGMITRDRVSVLLDGEGGMAPRAKIAVCTVDEKGKYKLVTTRTVQKGDFNRDIKIAVPDAFGKMVSVLVSKQGGIGLNGYRYKISLGEKSSKSETAGTLARRARGGKSKKGGAGKGDWEKQCDKACGGGKNTCRRECFSCVKSCKRKHKASRKGGQSSPERTRCVAGCMDEAKARRSR